MVTTYVAPVVPDMVKGVNPDLIVGPPDWIVAHMLMGVPPVVYEFTVRLLAA